MQPPSRFWPDYRTVWRWHFYAGLFCIPFVLLLSISGAIYLFKTEIEDWIDRPYDQLTVTGAPAAPSKQVQAALDAIPESSLNGYELPSAADSAARVIVRQNNEALRVYVHPQTLQVLGTVVENQRLMRWIFRLHGELLLGDRGSNLVELAASWTIIMILTGVYLWWPRRFVGLGGILFPRLGQGGKLFWRDLHSVTGFWVSGLALFLIVSGLPWAKFWGNYFKSVRSVTGTAVAQQDWTTGSERGRGSRPRADTSEHGEHSSRRAAGEPKARPTQDYSAIDRIVAVVAPLNLPRPVVISPPRSGSENWTAKSMTPNRPLRVNLTLNSSGEITRREDFKDRHLIDRVVGIGIAAHEGRLFGVANQALGLLTTFGLVLLSLTAVVLWLRRKSPGVLGAPPAAMSRPAAGSFFVVAVILGVLLPLFAASLAVVLIVERLLLVRLPLVRDWLGLRPMPSPNT